MSEVPLDEAVEGDRVLLTGVVTSGRTLDVFGVELGWGQRVYVARDEFGWPSGVTVLRFDQEAPAPARPSWRVRLAARLLGRGVRG